ncbi:MAG: hypothetical protein AAFZ15_15150 [Bacteroidota bacterium]
MKILINLFFAFLFIPVWLGAQGFDMGTDFDTLGKNTRYEIGVNALDDLKDGILIMRLKTGSSKLKAMEKVVNSKNVSPSEKKRFSQKINESKKEIENENNWLRESLDSNYSFSQILYMPDTAVHLLKAGKQSGYFYNEQMEIDPDISINNRSYLLAFYGRTSRATKTGEEGIVVLDRNFKELIDPFPHYTGLTTVRKTFDKIFNKKEEIYFYHMMALKFNERLVRFDEICEEWKEKKEELEAKNE